MTEAFTSLFKNFAAAACDLAPGAGGGFLGFPTWYKYLEGELVAGRCVPVLDLPNDLAKILLALFEIALRIAALAAVVFVIWGGIKYQISLGDPEGAKAARKIIINALIGLVITSLAAVIVSFIAGSLT